MIQRKQTLWLLINIAVACLAFILPFGYKNTTSMISYDINIHNFLAQHDIGLLILFSLLIAINLVSIFLFKNHKLQTLFLIFSIILSITCFAYEILFSTKDGNQITFGIANSSLYIGLLIPFVCLILSILAYKGVRNDVKLLKDADRLR